MKFSKCVCNECDCPVQTMFNTCYLCFVGNHALPKRKD